MIQKDSIERAKIEIEERYQQFLQNPMAIPDNLDPTIESEFN